MHIKCGVELFVSYIILLEIISKRHQYIHCCDEDHYSEGNLIKQERQPAEYDLQDEVKNEPYPFKDVPEKRSCCYEYDDSDDDQDQINPAHDFLFLTMLCEYIITLSETKLRKIFNPQNNSTILTFQHP